MGGKVVIFGVRSFKNFFLLKEFFSIVDILHLVLSRNSIIFLYNKHLLMFDFTFSSLLFTKILFN